MGTTQRTAAPDELVRVRAGMLQLTLPLHAGDLAVGAVGWILTQFLPQISAATGWPSWPVRTVLTAVVLVLLWRAVLRTRTGMLRTPLRPRWTPRGVVTAVAMGAALVASGNLPWWWARLVCMVVFSAWVVVGLPRALDRHRARVLDLLSSSTRGSTRGSAGHRAPWHGIDSPGHLSPTLSDPDALLLCVALEATGDAHLGTAARVAGIAEEQRNAVRDALVTAGFLVLEPKPVGERPREWARLTDRGHAALVAHLEALDAG